MLSSNSSKNSAMKSKTDPLYDLVLAVTFSKQHGESKQVVEGKPRSRLWQLQWLRNDDNNVFFLPLLLAHNINRTFSSHSPSRYFPHPFTLTSTDHFGLLCYFSFPWWNQIAFSYCEFTWRCANFSNSNKEHDRAAVGRVKAHNAAN